MKEDVKPIRLRRDSVLILLDRIRPLCAVLTWRNYENIYSLERYGITCYLQGALDYKAALPNRRKETP